MPKLTLWFLQASRSIRVAWVLEELGLDYELKFSNRENGLAPDSFKQEAGDLGKFPMLQDGDLCLAESGMITEYLCDTYDKQHKLLPEISDSRRYDVLRWVHASEATFLLHAISILYARWNQKDGDVAKTEEGLSRNVIKDMNFLESELQKRGTKFLCGNHVTAADTMMGFTIAFVILRQLGTQGKRWPAIEAWIKNCEESDTYKKAVERTGHKV